jgi:hypothetical protein
VTRARRLTPGMLAWIGVGAAPAAWALNHVFGMGLTLAACERAGSSWDIAVHAVTIVLTASMAAIAVLGGVASILAFRAVREAEKDDPPPPGRIFFLGIVGMAITPLFLAIILMSGSGVLTLTLCRQS